VDTRMSRDGKRKWLTLTVPIQEGIPYTLGEVSFDGNKLFPQEDLGKIFSQRKGKVLDKTLLGLQMKAIESKYGQKGYIYATATPIFKKNSDARTADVTVSISEDKQYFVNRIEFEGNTQTRDYVLRREMQIYEQEIFDYARYQRGLYRLKQGGIFEIKDDPVITKIPETNKVNVEVKGTEASKNEFLFGGGYGGVNGFFIQGSFRTYNFLGLGTTLSLNADVGKVQTMYSISYSDPWLFGHRIGATTSIFDNSVKYLQFDQKSRGGSFAVTFPLGDFAGWQVGYRYERSKANNFTTTQYLSPVYVNYLNSSSTSAIFGGIMYNSVNNPFRPMQGMSANLNLVYAGTFLGGDNFFVKPTADGTLYLPTFHKQNFAFRVSAAYIKPIQDHAIPIWERFFLGGEDSLRGFGVRSVYPLTKDGRHFVDPQTGTIEGGNRSFLTNIEYVFHVVQQVDIALFLDAGNTYHERQKLELSNYRADAGLEMRFFVPMFNVPLRLIYATNLNAHPHDNFSNFQFTIGLTF
jgi:outer membrane protein insertion porin family